MKKLFLDILIQHWSYPRPVNKASLLGVNWPTIYDLLYCFVFHRFGMVRVSTYILHFCTGANHMYLLIHTPKCLSSSLWDLLPSTAPAKCQEALNCCMQLWLAVTLAKCGSAPYLHLLHWFVNNQHTLNWPRHALQTILKISTRRKSSKVCLKLTFGILFVIRTTRIEDTLCCHQPRHFRNPVRVQARYSLGW